MFNHNQNQNRTRISSPTVRNHSKNKNKTIKVLQWNCQGLRGKLTSLQLIAQDYGILCFQETLLQETNKLSLKGFHLIRGDISGPGLRGICIGVRADVSYSVIDLDDIAHPSIEVVSIVLNIDDSPCLVVNVYRHPGQNTPLSVWDRLFSYQQKFPLTLFLGDFNAHHIHWYNGYEDGPGRFLAKAIDNHNFVILNANHPTLVLPPGSRDSIIDLSFASSRLAPLCLSSTLDDSWGSDHYPIVTIINDLVKPRKRFVHKLPLSSRLLAICSSLCSEHPVEFSTLSGITGEEKYDSFVSHIKALLLKLIPEESGTPHSSVIKPHKSPPPWWNETCQAAIDSRREAAAIFRK